MDRADRIEVDRNVWFPHLSQVVAEAVLALTSEPGSGLDLDRSIAMMDAECQAVDDLGLKFRTLLGAAITALVMYRHDRSGQARRWWRRGLEIGSEMGHLWGCWILLEFAAWDHEEAGRPLAAAELWGALEEYGRRAGLGQWSEIRAEGATRRTRARAVDPSAFEAARERGTRNPSIHELVAEHLG